MSNESSKKSAGIPCVAVTDAAREAILAVHEVFKDFKPEGEDTLDQVKYFRNATAAALKAALVAVGED